MAQPGSVVEVLVQSRGTQLVGDHLSAATTILVDDPTPFDTGGGQVFIDGTSYTYTSLVEVQDAVDPAATNGQLTLPAPGLVRAETDLTPVEVWNGSQVLDDLILKVATGEDGDPPVSVSLDAFSRDKWEGRLGPVDPPVAVVLSDDLTTVLDAPGYTPSINGGALVGFPDPAVIAIEPPDTSPNVTKVVGNSTGLLVTTDPILPTTLLDYRINGTTVAANQRTTIINLTTDNTGAPLLTGTDYSVDVVAHNSAGTAASSAAVTAQLDPGVTTAMMVALLQAGAILTGSLTVGQITIDPVSGITIPLSSGGIIRFPADGSDAAITAILRARSLVVENNLRVQGAVNAIEGGLQLANGITAPTVKAWVGISWNHAAAFDDRVDYITAGGFSGGRGTMWGLVSGLYDNGSAWISGRAFFGDGYIDSIDKTTGVSTTLLHEGSSQYLWPSSLTKVGTNWYVLFFKQTDGSWWVRKYNSSWVFQSQWQRASALTHNAMTMAGDGTFLYTTYRNGSGFLIVDRWNPDGTGGTVMFTSTVAPSADVAGLYVGNADYGALRYVVATKTKAYVFNSSGTEQTTQTWQLQGQTLGLAWDATRFHSFCDTGQIWHYTQVPSPTSRSVTYTWYDSDVTGGTHETQASPAATYTQPVRQWLRVYTDPPADAGGSDDPDSVRIYVANHLQPDLGAGVTSAVYDVPGTGGAAAPTSNGFTGASAPGSLTSGASDGSGALTKFDGSGAARIAKLIQSGHVSVSVSAAASGFVDVTFPVAFNSAPEVTATTQSTTAYFAVTSAISSTGVRVTAAHRDGTSGTATVVVSWIATTAA